MKLKKTQYQELSIQRSGSAPVQSPRKVLSRKFHPTNLFPTIQSNVNVHTISIRFSNARNRTYHISPDIYARIHVAIIIIIKSSTNQITRCG